MKNISIRIAFLFSFILIILATFGIVSGLKVQAQTALDSCYVFQPSSDKTVSVDLISSSGQKQTITIPNQNPPSILQNIYFYSNSNICALRGYLDRNVVNNYFVTANQLVPVTGNPLLLKRIDSNSGLIGPMIYTHYQGLVDLGMGKSTKTEQIKNEDIIIGSIDKEHKIIMQSSISSQSTTMSAPATNCVALSGNGPRKVVFMRGLSMNMTVSDFIIYTNQLIADSFKSIDPFKSHFDQFSFYVDLMDYNDYRFPKSADGNFFGDPSDMPGFMQFNNSVKTGSSCFGVAGSNSQYVFNFKSVDMASGYAGMTQPGVVQGTVFINENDKEFQSKETGKILLHEMGHSFAGLNDEYTIGDAGDRPYSTLENLRNCAISPASAYRSSIDNVVYGSSYLDGTVGIKGCTYLKSNNNLGAEFYKPSPRSIMNASNQLDRFNVISCGYIISAINGESLDKAHAQTHWPECMNLDTVKDGIPTSKTAPLINKITQVPEIVPGQKNAYKVAGSGFTPIDNSIRLMLIRYGTQAPKNSWLAFFSPQTVDAQTQSSATSYEILEIPSSDGVTLTFSVPNTVPDGTYSVSVGAFNSPWVNTSSTIIVSGNGKGDSTTAIGATPTQQVSNPTSTTPSNPADRILKYSCTSGFALNADNTCYKEGSTVTTPASTVARTVIYTCPSSPVGFENAAYSSGGLMKCVGRYPSPDYVARATYSCPVGTTLSGTVCNKPASTVITPASYLAPTISYSCATGYILSSNGGACSIPKTLVLSAVSSGGKINLSWTSDTLPSGSTFEIERMVRNGNFNILAGVINYNKVYGLLAKVTGDLRTYSDPINLPVVTTDVYSYRVRAKLADGTYTPYSNTITFTIAKDLTLVTGAQQELKKLTTPAPTASPTPNSTSIPTITPARTNSPSPIPYYSPSNSPSPSPTNYSSPVATPYYSPASVQSSSPTPIPTPTSSIRPSSSPTPIPSLSPTPSATPSVVSSNQTRIDAIIQLYVTLLKRQPDQGGLNYFVNSSMTIDQVRSTLIGSQEYRNLQSSASSPQPSSSPISQFRQFGQISHSSTASVFDILKNLFGLFIGR